MNGRLVTRSLSSLYAFLGTVVACSGLLSSATGAEAQELTPRAYWPAPKGIKVLVVGYAYATGEVFFDPTIPLYGVNSRVSRTDLAYLHTFSLWGRTTNVVVDLPYMWGTTSGVIVDTPASGTFSGVGDMEVTVAVNLLGAPTMTPQDFQALRGKPHPILGASLKVLAPTGKYDGDRLLNTGANRWAFRAELGAIFPLHPRWLLEIDAGVWLLGDDPDYIAGYRQQDPVFASQLHLVRRFKPGFWASLDLNFFSGGRQTIGGRELIDTQQNSKIGATVVVPIQGQAAIKIAYASGLYTEFGTDFDQFLVSYQVLFR